MNTDKFQTQQLPQTDVKCRFFGQYYGQEILRWHQWIKETPDSKVDLSIPAIEKSGWFIKLKRLEKITDEDAMSMFRGIERNYSDAKQFLDDYKSIGFLEQSEVDFLRSKGYAVPFMNYSVEDLVSFGWVRLV